MSDEASIELAQLAEKLLSQPIKDGLIAYCPSMDLFAVVTTDEQAQILRLNGQKVVSIPAKRGAGPVKLCWKPNGSLLAIAYSDNTLTLIAAQGGKIVHQIQCPVDPQTKVTALGWGVSFTDVPGIQALLSQADSGSSRALTLDDVVYRGFIGEVKQPKLDLPSDLASLDVESILPKLSILPVGGKEGEVFTTRASIDALFHSKDGKSSSADVLLLGFEDGSAWLSVHDFFELGRFDPKQIVSGKGYSIIKHAYHPYSSTQSLLLRKAAQDQDEVHFAPLDLRLIGENGRQFSLLASKATQLLNVLRYVNECQVQIYSEFIASQTLPQRFVANVEEDLQEKEQTSFKTAAYHLVATGNCSPVIKEWLVDQLGDRGQKRWEKAATAGYENTRRLLHENLLPALDRVNVLLTRLMGLSLFHETAEAFGLKLSDVDRALDTLKCLHLLGHSALLASDNELRQSIAFCAWLKQEIDTQATETQPLNPEDAEKEPNFDHADIFDYLEGPLQKSVLYQLFDIKHESDPQEIVESRETVGSLTENDSIYEIYKYTLQKARKGTSQRRLPGMVALVERLQGQCVTIFGRIADTQQKKVRFGELVSLGICHVERLDIRTTVRESDQRILNHIAVVSPDGSRAKVVRVELTTTKNVSSIADVQEALISARPEDELFDIKFIDDTTLCLGLKQGDNYRLMIIPYAGEETALSYSPTSHVSNTAETMDLLDEQVQGAFTRHMFGAASVKSSIPAKIEVNGRKGRRALCVVAQDGCNYRVYDIDSNADVLDDEERDEEGEDTVMSQ